MEEIHLNPLVVALIGSSLTLLFGIIAYFLSRLVNQFDGLTEQVAALNATMVRIDKDLSGDVGLLKERNASLQRELTDLKPMWDRLREVEADVEVIKQAGCDKLSRCVQ